MERKKNYEQPQTVVTQVKLESPICSGSVQFGGETDAKVDINKQEVISNQVNDFSGDEWNIQQ